MSPSAKSVVVKGAGELHERDVTIAPIRVKQDYGSIPTAESA